MFMQYTHDMILGIPIILCHFGSKVKQIELIEAKI